MAKNVSDYTSGQAYRTLVDFAVTHGDRSTDMGEFEPSMTRQEFSEECDINVIMAQYDKTGIITHVADREPRYVDYAAAPDFMTAMNMMNEARDAFMSLPAKVRREFDNDPQAFVEFAQDSKNLDQMRIWGLAPPAPEPPPAAPEPKLEGKPPKAKPAPVEPPEGE